VLLPQPNFLFFAADDLFSYRRFLRHDQVWGHAPFGINVSLPGLEKLEARSCIFERAYCAVPSCGPARAAVMSGYPPAFTGIVSNDVEWSDVLSPEQIWTYQIRQQGYRMETVGKIFHGFRPQPASVYNVLYDSPPFQPRFKPRHTPTQHGGMHGRGWDDSDEKFYDYMVASTAVDFLKTYDGSAPFWHEVGFHHPHMPFDNPNRIFESINIDDIIMPEAWKLGWDLLPFAADFWSGNALGTTPADWTDEEQQYWRLTVRNYIANIIWMDEQLERVIDALDASPFSDNTIITFYSDHGYHLADKGHWHKFTLWEEACAAPMMISVPGIAPRVIQTPVSMMDLGPTCLDYAGAEIGGHHRGISLRSVIEGQEAPERLIPTMWFGSFSAAVSDYRITLVQDGTSELYNISDDVWQQKNLAHDHPDYERFRTQLIALADDWGVQIVEEGLLPAPGSPFASYLGLSTDVEQTAQNFVAMGDLEVRAATPGYTRMWGAPEQDESAFELPPHVSEFHIMHKMRTDSLRLKGNMLDNKVVLGRIFQSKIYIDFGEGDDENSTVESWIHVDGGPGNDTLRTGSKGGILEGGAGDDTLIAGGGNNTLYGGAGNDTLRGGTGHNIYYSGHGTSQIICGKGRNTVYLDGGENTVERSNAETTIHVKRTGHIQRIRGFHPEMIIDLTDWAGLGDPIIRKVGPAAVSIRAARECIVIARVQEDEIRKVLKFV